MNKPTISSDLHTINTIQSMVNDLMKSRVCELEQWTRDALAEDFFAQAGEFKHAGREVEAMRRQIFQMLSELFAENYAEVIEEIKQPPAVAELPDIPARTKTLTVVPDRH